VRRDVFRPTTSGIQQAFDRYGGRPEPEITGAAVAVNWPENFAEQGHGSDPGVDSHESDATFVPVDVSNALIGLSIARDCFPEQDMRQIYREYKALLYSEGRFFEPSIHGQIQVVSDVVVYKGGEPAGIAGVYIYGAEVNTMWLSWFAVRCDLRGNGLGQKILQYCERVAAGHGAKEFAAYTEDDASNADCHRLYERCGYAHCESMQVEGVAMRVYRKPL
jgi:GNAT superfamily N-acetyltransferase